MRYDANCKELIVERYPTLNGITDDDKLLRFVLFMIQEDSPFLLAERDDYGKRIEAVTKHLRAEYPDIVVGENTEYNRVCTAVFMRMDNYAYVIWQSKLINFHQLNMFIRSPLKVDDMEKSIKQRLDVEKQLPDIHKSLVDYEKQIFPDTHTRKTVKTETARLLQFAEQFSVEKTTI